MTSPAMVAGEIIESHREHRPADGECKLGTLGASEAGRGGPMVTAESLRMLQELVALGEPVVLREGRE